MKLIGILLLYACSIISLCHAISLEDQLIILENELLSLKKALPQEILKELQKKFSPEISKQLQNINNLPKEQQNALILDVGKQLKTKHLS